MQRKADGRSVFFRGTLTPVSLQNHQQLLATGRIMPAMWPWKWSTGLIELPPDRGEVGCCSEKWGQITEHALCKDGIGEMTPLNLLIQYDAYTEKGIGVAVAGIVLQETRTSMSSE